MTRQSLKEKVGEVPAKRVEEISTVGNVENHGDLRRGDRRRRCWSHGNGFLSHRFRGKSNWTNLSTGICLGFFFFPLENSSGEYGTVFRIWALDRGLGYKWAPLLSIGNHLKHVELYMSVAAWSPNPFWEIANIWPSILRINLLQGCVRVRCVFVFYHLICVYFLFYHA